MRVGGDGWVMIGMEEEGNEREIPLSRDFENASLDRLLITRFALS